MQCYLPDQEVHWFASGGNWCFGVKRALLTSNKKKLAPCRGGNIVPLTTTTQKEKKLRGKGDDHFTTQRIFLWIVKLNCWDSFFGRWGD